MVLVYPIMVPYAFYKVLEREKGELFDKKEDGIKITGNAQRQRLLDDTLPLGSRFQCLNA